MDTNKRKRAAEVEARIFDQLHEIQMSKDMPPWAPVYARASKELLGVCDRIEEEEQLRRGPAATAYGLFRACVAQGSFRALWPAKREHLADLGEKYKAQACAIIDDMVAAWEVSSK
jgi:hypothetical protein